MPYDCPICQKRYGEFAKFIKHLMYEHGDHPIVSAFVKAAEKGVIGAKPQVDVESLDERISRIADMILDLQNRLGKLESTVERLAEAVKYVNDKVNIVASATDRVVRAVTAVQGMKVDFVSVEGVTVGKKVVLAPEVLVIYNYVRTKAAEKGEDLSLDAFINAAILQWARDRGLYPAIARVGEEVGEGGEEAA